MILYKYCGPERIDVIQNRCIRFTQPGSFNDPFEFRPVLTSISSDADFQSIVDRDFDRMMAEELEKLGLKVSAIPSEVLEPLCKEARATLLPAFRAMQPSIVGDLRQRLDHEFNRRFGVLCLSERWDSILMWGHYGCSHEGFAIGFDATHPFFNQRRTDKDEFGYLRKVRYQRNRPAVVLNQSSGLEWFETKADDWEYESEWRMFMVLSGASRVVPAPQGPIHLFGFPPESIRELILGLKCTASTEKAIRAAISTWSSQPPLFRCSIDDIEYRVRRSRA